MGPVSPRVLIGTLVILLMREWSPVDANEYGDMKCWLRSDPNTILNTVTFDNSQIMFAYVATIDNHYYNNMVCSLTWDLPTGWNAAVSFPACGLVNSGAHCAQDNITVQLHDSMALRCGGVIEMLDATYTHRQRLELTFESDESGYGPGCTALGWSHQSVLRKRRRKRAMYPVRPHADKLARRVWSILHPNEDPTTSSSTWRIMKAQFVAKTAVETLKAKDKEAEAKPCMCTSDNPSECPSLVRTLTNLSIVNQTFQSRRREICDLFDTDLCFGRFYEKELMDCEYCDGLETTIALLKLRLTEVIGHDRFRLRYEVAKLKAEHEVKCLCFSQANNHPASVSIPPQGR